MKLSVVIPIYNEEGVIAHTLPRFHDVFSGLGIDFEMICVDDGSLDRSWEELSEIAKSLPKIHALRLSRNFGHDAALFAGFSHAKGEYVATMDSDGEHPPEAVGEMLKEMEDSKCDVVNAVKSSRPSQSLGYRIAVTIFGGLLSQSLKSDLMNATEFKLLRREVVEVLLKVGDFHFFYRALVPWIGFRQKTFLFEPKSRTQGQTHWSFTSLVRFAVSGLILFSNLPIRLILYCGVLVLAVCVLVFSKLIWSYFFSEVPTGYATILTLLLLHLGLMMSGIGMLGLYVFATLRQSIKRPRAIVSDQVIRGTETRSAFVL